MNNFITTACCKFYILIAMKRFVYCGTHVEADAFENAQMLK